MSKPRFEERSCNGRWAGLQLSLATKRSPDLARGCSTSTSGEGTLPSYTRLRNPDVFAEALLAKILCGISAQKDADSGLDAAHAGYPCGGHPA
ncbi:MAG: hypothetical protein ACT4PN_10680 [Nitrospiraceae bacterium]